METRAHIKDKSLKNLNIISKLWKEDAHDKEREKDKSS